MKKNQKINNIKISDLIFNLKKKDRYALSKLISLITENSKKVKDILINTSQNNSYVIGITGPPGAGKSTIIDGLISLFRNDNYKVGVIAYDPNSPFTGGAILGDRIRMQKHVNDKGVYIRSLGSRGSIGGLSNITSDVIKLYKIFGFDYIIVESIGVGQNELDIYNIADTTIVILVPESGDSIQLLKAGVLEIADIFCVNKSDREGSSNIAQELKSMIELNKTGWKVPVINTIAQNANGLDNLYSSIFEHKKFRANLKTDNKHILKQEIISHVLDLIKQDLAKHFDNIKLPANLAPSEIAYKFYQKHYKK